MNKKIIAIALGSLLFALSLPAEAQQPGKVYRIGYLSPASATTSVPARSTEAFRQTLRELAWLEGQNIVIEYRYADGKIERFPELAAELVRLKVDCIIAWGVQATRTVKLATNTIPIVMGNADDDPVRQGLVASLARPGGNVTGFTNIGSDLAGKRLELLKEVIPKLSRVAILWDSRGQASAAFYVIAGGLMGYASDDSQRYRGVATYVDKILKGTKPSDLPVQQPTKFEFVINLKTAKQIGLTIPPSVLARADRIIR